MQDPTGVMRTDQLLKKPVHYVIFADKAGYAEGSVFFADGLKDDEEYMRMRLKYSDKNLQFTRLSDWMPELDAAKHPNVNIDYLHIFDNDIEFGDETLFACGMDKDLNPTELTI